jgi:hypothetical protein
MLSDWGFPTGRFPNRPEWIMKVTANPNPATHIAATRTTIQMRGMKNGPIGCSKWIAEQLRVSSLICYSNPARRGSVLRR